MPNPAADWEREQFNASDESPTRKLYHIKCATVLPTKTTCVKTGWLSALAITRQQRAETGCA